MTEEFGEISYLRVRVEELLEIKEACHELIRRQDEEIDNLRAEVSDLQVEQETHYCEDTAHDDCISDEQYERVIQERDKALSLWQRVLDKREYLYWEERRNLVDHEFSTQKVIALLDEILESPR